MAKNEENVANNADQNRAANPNDNGPIDNPPLGNAADPTASVADDKAVNPWSVRPEDRDRVPSIDELHTVGMPDQEPRGALGKTDPNLGQDTPLGGGEAEGRNKDAA